MKRAIFVTFAFVFFVAAAAPTTSGSVDWTPATMKVQRSLVRVTHPVAIHNANTGQDEQMTSVCTGFVIHAERKYVATDEHCYGEGMQVDGKPAYAVAWWDAPDMMILAAPQLEKPALKPSDLTLTPGMPIAAYGYGFGLHTPLFRGGHISAVKLELPEIPGAFWIAFDGPYIGGMSGGPIYDINGNVVGIVQRSNSYMGIGQDIDVILQVTGQYWENSKKGK